MRTKQGSLIQSTPIEVVFDNSFSRGVKIMRNKLKEMEESVTTTENKSTEMEREAAMLNEKYLDTMKVQRSLRLKVENAEDRISELNEEIRLSEVSLHEYKVYFREMDNFDAGASIREAELADQKLKEAKQLCRDNVLKYNNAQQQRGSLVEKLKLMEWRAKAVHSKFKELKTVLRKTRQLKRTLENGDESSVKAIEQNYKVMEGNLDNVTQRIMDASFHVNTLEIRLRHKSDELTRIQRDREDIECTIKLILRQIKEEIRTSKT